MQHSLTAMLFAVAAPHLSAAYSIHGQLTNEVQNGVSIARFYDPLNRPTGCSVVAASASCSEAEGKWRSGPESFAEKQKGRYFGFYRCLPSGDVHIIGLSYEPFIQ